MSTLNKDSFLFSCNHAEKTVTININNFSGNLKNYSAVLVAHNEHGEIVIKTEAFKKSGESNFKKAAYPIFCLIISQGNCNETKKYISEQTTELANTTNNSPIKLATDPEFYFHAHQETIAQTLLDITLHYSKAINREAALGLLVFNNDSPHKPTVSTFYEFSELEKEIASRKKLLAKLTSYHDRLALMKKDIEGCIGNLIDFPGNKFKEEDILAKIEKAILFLKKNIDDKENFLHIPTLAVDKQILNLEQVFKKIESIYSEKENILQKNKEFLLERENFISQAIADLEPIQRTLKAKKEILADELASKIGETEKVIFTLIEELTAKEKDIASLSHQNYNSLKDEYNVCLEKIKEELTSYTQRADATINERKIQLRKEKNKLISENGIDEFRNTLADEVLSEFAKQLTYHKYTNLLTKLDSELADGCTSLRKIEALKEEIASLSPQLTAFKKEYETRNAQVILTRKNEISSLQDKLKEIEGSLTSVSNELYGVAEFPANELSSVLKKLKLEAKHLTEDKFSILNKEILHSLKIKFESLKSDFAAKIAAANKKSDGNIRAELHNIQQHTTTLENTEFSEKLKSLLKKPDLKRSQLENIVAELLIFKKAKVQEVKEEITQLEKELKSIADSLYGSEIANFQEQEFTRQLTPIKKQLNELSDDKKLSEYTFDAIDVKFKQFKTEYATTTKKISEESKRAIKAKLSEIKKHSITQENQEFSKKIDLLLPDEVLTKSKLEPIIKEFYFLKLDQLLKRLEAYTEKLINRLFSSATDDKLKAVRQMVLDFTQIKNCFSPTAPIADTDIKKANELANDPKLTDNLKVSALTKHRGFFKLHLVSGETLANEATQLADEIKFASFVK